MRPFPLMVYLLKHVLEYYVLCCLDGSSRKRGVSGFCPYSVQNAIQSTPIWQYTRPPPQLRKLGRARKLSNGDEEALFEYLLSQGWRQQDELVWWLYNERGVHINQSTLSRIFRRRGWTRKELQRISLNRSDELRRAYIDDIRQFGAQDLIFIDESIFNEKTGWRHHAYAPIGHEARYETDIQRGKTWSICAAMPLDDWLPCTGIKEGYYRAENFIHWLQNHLIPAVNQHGHGRPMVIVMDNVAIHVQEEVTQLIESSGHIIRYLPPYSPGYNPIELTFSVLKAWMKRNWPFYHRTCQSYGEFLEMAIRDSCCGRYARSQFQHAAAGVYIETESLMNFVDF